MANGTADTHSQISEKIKPIYDAIVGYPNLSPELSHEYLKTYLEDVINGDEILKSITVVAARTEVDQELLTLLVTTTRVVAIAIQGKDIKLMSSYLNQVIGIKRDTDIETKRSAQTIQFMNGNNFNLGYPTGDEVAEGFFKAVDEELRKINKPK